MYRQQTIDFLEIRSQIDQMFPVKAKATPTDDWASIEARAKARMPKYYRRDRYSSEVLHWIATDPNPVSDTQAVTARRVSRSMVTGLLDFSEPMPMREIRDGQAFVDNSGLCLETYNADGEVVGKFFPTRDSVSFI